MNENIDLYLLLGFLIIIILFVLLVGFIQFSKDFLRELRYLNNEIGRTDGAERKRWIR